jgi:hypothetical protein
LPDTGRLHAGQGQGMRPGLMRQAVQRGTLTVVR